MMRLCEHCGVAFYPPALDWIEFVATADGKTYKIHFSELQMAQDRGLVKTVLGKVPFSPVHCDLCSRDLAVPMSGRRRNDRREIRAFSHAR